MYNKNDLGLNPKQNERHQSVVFFYGAEAASDLVMNHVSAKGPNSWISIQEKISLIRNSDRKRKQYEDAMYEEFDLQENCSFDMIIQKVSAARADLDLPQYTRSIKANSIADFLNLFIVEKIYDEESTGIKKKEIGYKPVFRLKPE